MNTLIKNIVAAIEGYSATSILSINPGSDK
jgi:hypothetical protein